MENGLSWLSLGNSNVVTPRNTIISSDYNDLTNKPIITLNGTNQNPIKLWTLEMGVYILNGYIQHSNELMSEGKGLFVTIAAMMVNGKYVVSAYIPFWEGLYEYILPSSSSETYTQHQIINMVSQENTLTLDNEKIYTPMENYHPSTKKYADDMFTILRNELSNIGINRDNIEDLKQVNRRRDIIIQALLSQNSDKTVTIEEEKHNISLDLAIDRGMTTINELEGSTLVNVSKQKESIPLSCKADTVENTNVANLTENGVIRPIIQGNTLVNNNIQWDDKVVIGNQIEQMSGVEVNIEDCNGEIDVALEGHTGVNLSNRKGGLLSTTFDSQSGNYITLNPSEDCGTTLEIEGNTMVNYCNNGNISMGLNKEINVVDDTGKMITLDETVDNGLVDVKLSGKTLVNLADIHPAVKETCTRWYNDYTLCETAKLKLNEPYTFIIDCKYLEGHNSNYYYFEFGGGNIVHGYNGSIATNLNMNRVNMPNSGVYALRVEFKDFRGYKYLSYRPCRRPNEPVEGEMANYDISVLLLEGDHTDKDISYFEGLKSVGQDSDGIEISISNKNILKPTKEKYRFCIKKGTKLVLSEKNNTPSLGGNVLLYDINGNIQWFSIDADVTNPRYITVWEDVHYIQNALNGDLEYQVEVGAERTQYVSHSSNKKTLLYYNPTTQTWEKPVLREWDSIEKHSNGKYYYHKRSREIIFDGSSDENWYSDGNTELNCRFRSTLYSDIKGYTISDRFNSTTWSEYNTASGNDFLINGTNGINVTILKTKLSTQDVAGFKAWLQANPTTVVYQLAQEEVYECTNLSLDTYSNQTNIFNNSLIPCNMEIKNSTYDCILSPNTKYTVKLDSNISNDIQVNLGGTNTVVNTNIFEITTPNELTNESLTLYGNGEIVNNAMLFIDDMDNVDTDGYFEGMKSSFEDRHIPSENLWNINELLKSNVWETTTITNNSIKINNPTAWTKVGLKLFNTLNKTYTLAAKIEGNPRIYHRYEHSLTSSGVTLVNEDNVDKFIVCKIKCNTDNNIICFECPGGSQVNYNNIVVLEGDWSHLSEEDFNHLGKYKVEYKVTGKNKLPNSHGWEDGQLYAGGYLNLDKPYKSIAISTKNFLRLNKGVKYTFSYPLQYSVAFHIWDLNYKYISDSSWLNKQNRTFIPEIDCYIKVTARLAGSNITGSPIYNYPTNPTDVGDTLLIQLEEGSVATEYEPYKESIKTLYLNSPLLEGDKIVTYKGNVCHYHKMGKVVLDGSEDEEWKSFTSNNNGISYCYNTSALSNVSNSKEVGLGYGKLFCDKLKYIIQDGTKTINQHSLTGYNQIARNSGRQYSNYIYISTTCSDGRSFKQWLAENPVAVIYELTNPYYEIIESNADTSIELFSNVSYLSVDTSVPINFVEFKPYTDELTYLENNTQYRVTFNCNVEGKPISISLGGTEIEDITKLENSVLITTPNELVDEKLIIDGKGIVNIDNVRVTKGDMMYNKYFEGMKSSFEMEDTVKTIIKYCPIEFGKGGRIE